MADFKKQLLAVLKEIKGSGTFVSTGTQPFVFPGMEVQGVGEISFPVNEAEAKRIIQHAHKAPFGKGSETVLDNKVRSAWEMDAEQIRFTNSDWNKFIEKLIKHIKPELGIKEHSVSAHLYKLLIYEKGDFFLPHKDSEKEPGMFGTLIICLPSRHEGGELLVSFDSHTQTIDFSEPAKKYLLSFAAFYADCEHEIKPVRSGHRTCLVYNLVQEKSEEKIQLQHLESFSNQLAAILKTAEEDKDIPKIVLLGHQYTPSNFTMASLKLNDRPKAKALLMAAEKAGFYAKLGLVTSYQMGELITDYDSRSYRSRRRKWYDDEDSDEDVSENGSMGEVYEEYMEVEHWMKEGVPPLRELPFEETDLISSIPLNEGEPVEKEATEYTGNAGMDMQYWYHYGAVFLWPRKYHYDMLITLPVENKLEWIAYYNQHWDQLQPNEIALTKKLVEKSFASDDTKDYKLDFSPLTEWLIHLNDEKYLIRKGRNLLASHFINIPVESWMKLIAQYGPDLFAEDFTTAGQAGKKKIVKHLLVILHHLAAANNNYALFIADQVEKIPAYIKAVNLAETKGKETAKAILQETLSLSMMKQEDEDWLHKTASAFTKELNRDFVNDVLVGVILSTDKRNSLAGAILKVCIKDLKNRVDAKPSPPADWSRPVPETTGYYNNEWKILKPFLMSPTQQVFDYQRVQAERTQMEQAIKSVTIDLRMETIRKGSPHTLRLIKTQDAYERDLSKWKKDGELLNKAEKRAGA